MKILITNGANVDVATLLGSTTLMLAARQGHLQIVEVRLWLQVWIMTASMEPFGLIFGIGRIASLPSPALFVYFAKVLIASGGNMNAVNSHNETALMGAAWWGHDNVVSALIATGNELCLHFIF